MFTKTGAPEKGVRVADEGWTEEDVVPYEDDGFVTPPEDGEAKEGEDAPGEK